MDEDELLSAHGVPDVMLNSSDYKNNELRNIEGVCEEYALFFNIKAKYGMLVFGRIGQTWFSGPDLNWPLTALAKRCF